MGSSQSIRPARARAKCDGTVARPDGGTKIRNRFPVSTREEGITSRPSKTVPSPSKRKLWDGGNEGRFAEEWSCPKGGRRRGSSPIPAPIKASPLPPNSRQEVESGESEARPSRFGIPGRPQNDEIARVPGEHRGAANLQHERPGFRGTAVPAARRHHDIDRWGAGTCQDLESPPTSGLHRSDLQSPEHESIVKHLDIQIVCFGTGFASRNTSVLLP